MKYKMPETIKMLTNFPTYVRRRQPVGCYAGCGSDSLCGEYVFRDEEKLRL